ncbi:hypothetical protein Tco_0607350, partial [Tanacetum coccineum]
ATQHSESMIHWEARVREHLPPCLRFQETPSEPPTDPTFVPCLDDPYVMIRDAAIATAKDNDGDDTATSMD